MDNKFISKLSGSGELHISKLQGFHEPDMDKKTEKRLKKILKKNCVSTAAWATISFLFAVMYGYVYLSGEKTGMVFLVAPIVFLVMSLMGGASFILIDLKTYKAVCGQQYEMRSVQVDHISPGFSTTGGKAAAKIKDENGNVYSHEFPMNKRLKKLIKKDPEREFFVIRVNGRLYCLAEAPKKGADEEAEKEAEMEMGAETEPEAEPETETGTDEEPDEETETETGPEAGEDPEQEIEAETETEEEEENEKEKSPSE